MQSDKLITRRATVDDLPQLMQLWSAAFYPADILEKRLTEFHLVEDAESKRILAAIAIHPEDNAVMLHSEVFGDLTNQDLYRDMLWPRFQALARNLGVSRIWTQESAPFWKKVGFASVTKDILSSRPNFPDSEEHLPWLSIQIFNEKKIKEAMGDKFEQLIRQQQDETEAFTRQLRVLRNVIIVLGVAMIGFMLILFLYSFATAYSGTN